MSADLLRRLIETGTPAELVAEVAVLVGQAAALDRRRTSDRERQAARRHVTSRDTADVTLPTPSPDKSPPDPQKLTPIPVPAGRDISARASFEPPNGVSGEQWRGFLKLRTAKRQPMTERGYTLLCGKLTSLAEHGFPPGEMIDLAIERGWTTVHAPKETPKNGHGPHYDRQQRPSGWEAAYHAKMGAVGPG